MRAICHRGPDDMGEWSSSDGRVGLGHRRLAIIDLSPAGHQPMVASDGQSCIVFNGEMYNYLELRPELAAGGYQFRSESDTEVVLAAYRAWGSDCLKRLHGMFAFAIYDVARRSLLIARDRAGEKPLFYEHDGDRLRFASELKALTGDGTRRNVIDRESLDCYLGLGFVPGDRAILKGLRKLPPAHALRYDLASGGLTTWRYWSPPALVPADLPPGSEEAMLLDELEPLLESAVKSQLVADVPVGVLLSGGLDSSLVTAMAVRAVGNLRTFTVRIPGYGGYDETEHARLIARHYGTDHLELAAEETTVELLPKLARQFDEPIIDSSMLPTYLVTRLVREHCKVALGGDGGDELFGGYSLYDRLLRMERLAKLVPRYPRKMIAAAAGKALPVGFKGRGWAQSFGADTRTEVPLIGLYFDRRTRCQLLSGEANWVTVAERVHAKGMPVGGDLLRRAALGDFENYLPEDILVKVDRASMLNSLEVRAPMLDVRVIEFAFGRVPSRLKATPIERKILLKKLAKRVLPPAFDTHRKQGFSIPLDSWLRSSPWQEYFRDVLLDNRQVLLDRGTIRRLLDGQLRGRSNGERLFGLVMFELWRREYGAEL